MGEPKPLWVIMGISLLALVGCEPEGITSDWKRLESPVPAPDFTLPQIDGGAVHFADLQGRVVIMEFWATWCGPCRFSLPSLEVIYTRYRDRGVSVLLVNEGEAADRVRAWAERRFTAPILLDQRRAVADLYRVAGIPRLFVVDQQGKIMYAHQGYGGGLEHNLTLILDDLLKSGKAQPHV